MPRSRPTVAGMQQQAPVETPRALRAGDGDISPPAGVRDRFMVDGTDADGRFTYVLSGRIGALLGDTEVEAEPGDLLFKPRGQWHTCWNAGDEPAAVLEIISPAGLEQFFRALANLDTQPDPDELARLAAPYKCDADIARTTVLVTANKLDW